MNKLASGEKNESPGGKNSFNNCDMQVTYLETPKPVPNLKNPHEIELSRQHLLAELARLDLLLQRQIQRWQEAGQDPTDAFRGLYVSDQEASALMARPISSNWAHATHGNGHTSGDPFASALKEATLQSHALAEAARHQNHPPHAWQRQRR